MSIAALLAVRDRLAADALLVAFWQDRYTKDVKHWVGYKRTPSANDYPSLCYVPMAGQFFAKKSDELLVSVVIGVHEPGITANVFDGIAATQDAKDLIIAALTNPLKLESGWSGWEVNGVRPIAMESDLGARHPFYELELHIPLIYRK
jgi:hypothetical protein